MIKSLQPCPKRYLLKQLARVAPRLAVYSESMVSLYDNWAIPLNRNTPPTEDHKLSPGGSQRINYSFVPGGYKICHCPREVAAVRHCPGGVRAFYNTLGLYKFPVQGRGLS